MDRTKRDYCDKHHHPRWRAWTAKYDMTVIAWPWIGNFCTQCGARVDGVGEGSPDSRLAEKLRILRGLGTVAPGDVEKFRARLEKYKNKIRNLRARTKAHNVYSAP